MPIFLEKPLGVTPLDLLNSLPKPPGKKYSFAGRLDPMARGKMIVLEDDECRHQDRYCGLDKIYQFSILYGFQTDTYDVLGLLSDSINSDGFSVVKEKISNLNLSNYIGKKEQPYPAFSSIKVKKHPLWWWTKENRLDEITIPSKLIEIYSLEETKTVDIYSSYELLMKITEKIYCLPTHRRKDFRVPSIMERWNQTLLDNSSKWLVGHYQAKVSSGTYIRTLVNQIGSDLGVGAIAFDIHRTQFLDKKNIR